MTNKPQFVGEKQSLENRVEYVRGVTYNAAVDLHRELDNDSYVLLRANNIQEGELRFDDVQYVDRAKVKPKQLLQRGDILFCTSSGSKGLVGKAALVRESMPVTFGAFCCVLRPTSNESEYLSHYFQSQQYRAAIEEACSGSNIKNLKAANFLSLIVSRYDDYSTRAISALFDSIDDQIKQAKNQLSSLDSLVKSRFVEMFGELETNTKSWPVEKFDSFAVIDTHMISDLSNYAEEPHIGIDCIEAQTGRLRDYRTVSEDGVTSGKYLFTAKHIIYSKIRPNLNKVALPTFSGVCSADAYPILPVEDKCNRVFLAQVMRSNTFLDYILPLSGRAQMPKVNKQALRGFSTPLPPLALQQEFAAFVAQVDKSRFVAQQQIEKLQMLYDSLAQEYFGD